MKLKNENKLTDADLEQVVGGGQLDQDSRFLNVLLQGREGQIAKSVKNEYYIDGKRVSRREAFKHAAYKAGRPEVYDYDYSRCAL